jgi:hypothetical protein
MKHLDKLLLDDKTDDLIGKTNWSVIETDPSALAVKKPKKALKKNYKEF